VQNHTLAHAHKHAQNQKTIHTTSISISLVRSAKKLFEMAENNNNHGRDNAANAAFSPAVHLLVKEMAAAPDNAQHVAEEMIKARVLEDAMVLVASNPEAFATAVEEMKKKHGVDFIQGIIVPHKNSNK